MAEDVGLPAGEDGQADMVPTAGADAIKLPEVANLSAER